MPVNLKIVSEIAKEVRRLAAPKRDTNLASNEPQPFDHDRPVQPFHPHTWAANAALTAGTGSGAALSRESRPPPQ